VVNIVFFYNFFGFRSVAVNRVYKLQYFTLIHSTRDRQNQPFVHVERGGQSAGNSGVRAGKSQ